MKIKKIIKMYYLLELQRVKIYKYTLSSNDYIPTVSGLVICKWIYPVSSKKFENILLKGYVFFSSTSELTANEGQNIPKNNRVISHNVKLESVEHILECIP